MKCLGSFSSCDIFLEAVLMYCLGSRSAKLSASALKESRIPYKGRIFLVVFRVLGK